MIFLALEIGEVGSWIFHNTAATMFIQKTNPLYPLVRSVQTANKTGAVEWRTDWNTGIMVPPGGTYLDVRASRFALERILRIADLVLKKCEEHGYPVAVSDDGKAKTSIAVSGERLGLRIDEKVSEVLYRDSWRAKHSSFACEAPPKYGWTPSGLARVVIYEPRHYYRKQLKVWIDGPRYGKIEGRVDSIVETLDSLAQKVKARRRMWDEELERQRIRREEAERLRAEQNRVADRGNQLEIDARLWERCRLLREYVDAIEEASRRGLAKIF